MCAVMSISLMPHEALAVSVEPDMGINPIVNVGATASEQTASAEVDKWQKEVDAATSNITVLTKQLEEYTKIVKQKETSLSEAEAVVALGSYGYFQYKKSTDAMNILKGENVNSSYLRGSTAPAGFIGYTHIGQADDATSLINMKRSFAWIKECNEIRASEGLSACTVNDVAMAMAQTDANYSSNVWGHAKYYFIAENIAKGYAIERDHASGIGGPFVGWYTREKTLYQQNVSKYDGASSMSSYELSQKYPNFYQQVGHYLNIIVEGTPVTGLAVNSEAFVHAQEFDSYGKTGKGIDVETYEKDFLTYYDKVTGEVMKAESELSEAKANVTDTEAKKKTAQNALANASSSLTKAKEAYEKSKNTVSDSSGTSTYTVDEKASDNSTADKIADYALKNNKTIKTVRMGDNIREVGTGAFYGATKLSVVYCGKNVEKIGKNAFRGDKKLGKIIIYGNQIKKIGKNAFKGIKKKATIIIYAKNRKTYNKVVSLIRKSGAKSAKFKYKKWKK